jgi:hypothetical protein
MANDTKKTPLPQTARERQGAEPPGWEDWGHPCSACSDTNLCRENAGRAYRRGRGCEARAILSEALLRAMLDVGYANCFAILMPVA